MHVAKSIYLCNKPNTTESDTLMQDFPEQKSNRKPLLALAMAYIVKANISLLETL